MRRGQRLAALAVIALALTVPPLELIPFASTIPMATIALFGLGLLFEDGRLVLVGWIASMAAAIALTVLVPWEALAHRFAG